MESLIAKFGLWGLLGFAGLWLTIHLLAKPGTEIGFFGFKYTKRDKAEPEETPSQPQKERIPPTLEMPDQAPATPEEELEIATMPGGWHPLPAALGMATMIAIGGLIYGFVTGNWAPALGAIAGSALNAYGIMRYVDKLVEESESGTNS